HQSQQHWTKPALSDYRDLLLQRGLTPSSVQAHLSTIRGQYKRLLRNSQARDLLYRAAVQQLSADGQDPSPANVKAYVDEALTRLEADVQPENASVKVVKQPDIAQSEHLRLTAEQASHLLSSPDTSTVKGLRDAPMIGLMLCTGVREAELVAVTLPDLR